MKSDNNLLRIYHNSKFHHNSRISEGIGIKQIAPLGMPSLVEIGP